MDSLRGADAAVQLVSAAHLVLGRSTRPAAEPDVPGPLTRDRIRGGTPCASRRSVRSASSRFYVGIGTVREERAIGRFLATHSFRTRPGSRASGGETPGPGKAAPPVRSVPIAAAAPVR